MGFSANAVWRCSGLELHAWRYAWIVLLTALGALHTSPVRAAERGPALNWVRLSGAESCIAPVELTDLVEHRLGRAVFVRARDAIVVIEGRVEPSPPIGFSVVLRVSDPDGTLYGSREIALADADCRKLDDVVALVIAVTIRHGSGGSGIVLPYTIAQQLDRLFADDSPELDPSRLPPSPQRPPLAAASGSSPPTAATRAARDESGSSAAFAQPPDAAARAAWDATAGVWFSSGLQPEFTFAPSLAGRFALAAIGSIEVSVSAGLPKAQTLGGGEAGTLRYNVMAGGLALCAPSWWVGTSELGACAAAALGNVRVSAGGFSLRTPATNELWVEVGPRLFGRAQLVGPAFLQLTLTAPIRLRAPEFEYRSSLGRRESAFQMARVGMQVELSAGVRF